MVQKFAPWQAANIQLDSVERYNSTWVRHLGPKIGSFLFAELDLETVEKIFLEYEPGIRASCRGLMVKIVRRAIAHGLATPELLIAVQLVSVPKKTPKVRHDVASLASEMLEASRGHYIEGFIYAGITLGLRKGELCGLKRADLDEESITLRRQRNHKRGEKDRLKHRKEGEFRRIGLPKSIATKILSYHRAGSIYLFTDDKGRPLQYQHIDRDIEPFQSEKGRITPHDFRAAAIVNLIEAGVGDHTIMDLVGHGSARMIRVYRDNSEQRTRDALKRLTGEH